MDLRKEFRNLMANFIYTPKYKLLEQKKKNWMESIYWYAKGGGKNERYAKSNNSNAKKS